MPCDRLQQLIEHGISPLTVAFAHWFTHLLCSILIHNVDIIDFVIISSILTPVSYVTLV